MWRAWREIKDLPASKHTQQAFLKIARPLAVLPRETKSQILTTR